MVSDSTPEELRIKEVNVVRVLIEGGWRAETVQTDDPMQALGVNDRADLARAEAGLAGGEAHPR
jgi:bifunctional N-acetylglucosamine-1-phosphate-uridyltransferase/glucosamine-1-phosphate-acetyltransferase GlmU-like protein